MINLAPEAWGRGLGRTLLEAATTKLRDSGYREAVLWVLDGNARARRFYEAAGWSADGTAKREDMGGTLVTEVRYRREL
jgi:RimJ/RimL family protein N-acetyltransferase